MNILYIGSERSDAQAVVTALQGLEQDVTVSWASCVEHALRWLDEHRDIAALVVEAQTNAGDWPSILKHSQGLTPQPAVVVILPEGMGPPSESLHPEADEYIARTHSLLRDLPPVVTRAIARARGYQQLQQALNGVADTRERFEISPGPHDNRSGFAQAAPPEHRSQPDGLLDLERAARLDLEQKLAYATAALQDAEQRHLAATVAAGKELAERQAQYEIGMARAAATWEMVDEQLRTAALEVERARQSQVSAAAEVDRLSRRDAELSSQLAEAVATHGALERRLAQAEAAVDTANARTEHERLAAAEQLAERQRQFEALVAREVDKRRAVEDMLAQAVSARVEAEEQHASAMAAAAAQSRDLEAALLLVREDVDSLAADVERLTTRETDLESMLADVTTSRNDLERRLAATEAAFDDASTRATRERLAASKKAAAREAELDGQIRQERATRATLEQTIADADVALRGARERHDAALAAAANELAERQAHFDRELAQIAEDRDRLTQRLIDAEVTLDHAQRDYQLATANVERLTEREADLASELAGVQASRHTLEIQLADAASAIRHAAVRESELDGQIQLERATRAALEQAIADADTALRDARHRHDAAMATAANERAERQAHFDRELSQIAEDRDRLAQRLSDAQASLDAMRHDHQVAAADIERLAEREADLTRQLGHVEAARHTLELQLADALKAIADADERAIRDRTAAADRHADLESRLAQEIATRNTLEQSLAETRSAAVAAERSFQEEADALRARGLEQEAHFDVQLAQERLEHESRLAEMQERHRTLALERDALQQSLSTIQEQSKPLQRELAESRAESHRLFEQAGLAMFRCAPDGGLIHANRACTTLLGRRGVDELSGAHFAATVFEAPNVLSWLIERCVSTRAKESIETAWRRKDGGRLFVRLSARMAGSEIIEVAAEDLTRLRVLEERLVQAHRMEAVGRFASEVAVTCDNLLSDIHQKSREWLETATGDAYSRQQGELLLEELKRAAGFVRQLAACGDEQTRTPMLVDLNTLIRDLEPVLKRVAGGDVDIQLLDTSTPLNVDVGTERVERLLVNLASYGRERMPSGGRLKIELGTVVVDRHFVARHPNVRLGLHASITVTEIRRATRADGSLSARNGPTLDRSPGKAAPKRGIDFATLQGLVSECGGHLWMKVQSLGEMVAKIRLPLLSPYDQTRPRPTAARGGRERPTTGWLHSGLAR